jgi:hypothetical protein
MHSGLWCSLTVQLRSDRCTSSMPQCPLLCCLVQVCATPDQLLSALQSFDASQLQPFPAKDPASITDAIDEFMRRPRKAA